jgi:hypothetical protein
MANEAKLDQYSVNRTDEAVLDTIRAAADDLLDAGSTPSSLPRTLHVPLTLSFIHDQVVNGGTHQIFHNAEIHGLLDAKEPNSIAKFVNDWRILAREIGLLKLEALLGAVEEAAGRHSWSFFSPTAADSEEPQEKLLSEAESSYYQSFTYHEVYSRLAVWAKAQADFEEVTMSNRERPK